MGRSSSQRPYRSISSRKERRRNIREGNHNSDSDDSSNRQSDSESSSGIEDNWEDDYHESDSDSYYSGRGSKRKEKKDEELGLDDENTHYEDPSENGMKSPASIKSSKSAKGRGSKLNVDSDEESENESDSDSSDSDSDSDGMGPIGESDLVKTKLKAIALTVLLMLFLITIIVLGAIFGIRKSRAAILDEPKIVVTEAPVMEPTEPPVTNAPTSEVELIPTLVPTIAPTKVNAPTDAPIEEIITGDIPSEDDDFFNESDEVVVDENGIPDRQSEDSNGDTYVITLANGTIVQDAEKEKDKLLVQSRNSGEVGNDISNATSYALVNFNMGDVSWYENDGVLGEYVVDAYICLEHITSEDPWGNPQFDSVTGEAIQKVFSICRLKNNVTLQEEQVVLEEGQVGTGDDVETIVSPSYKMPDDCMGGKIKKFFVSSTDTMICIDVSSMVRNFTPFVAESAEEAKPVENGRLRRRHLENHGNATAAEGVLNPSTKDIIPAIEDSTFENKTSYDNIFDNKNETAFESFYPNEEGVPVPTTKDKNTPANASSLESKNETELEAFEPNEEKTSVPESLVDEAVLETFEPGDEPDFTTTPEPTTESPTTSPTGIGDKKIPEIIVDPSNFKNMLFMIANLEENQDASAQFYSRESGVGPSLVLDLREFAPTVSPTPGDSEEVSNDGEEEYIEEGIYPPCGVCGIYKSISPLDSSKLGIVPFDLAPDLTMIARNKTDQTASASCYEWERICNKGQCSPQLCESLIQLSEFCGCEEPVEDPCEICQGEEFLQSPLAQVELTAEQSPNGEAATMSCSFLEGYCEAGFCNAKVCSSVQSDSLCSCTSAPTLEPTLPPEPTEAPTPSPTFKAEHTPCSICGENFDDLVLTNVVVQIQEEQIRPPQVTSGNATCTELESYCRGGYCDDIMCASFQQASIQEACGCPIDNVGDGAEDGEDILAR